MGDGGASSIPTSIVDESSDETGKPHSYGII